MDVEASEELLRNAAALVRQGLERRPGQPMEWSYISARVREVLGAYLHRETRRRPMIIPVPVEV